MRLAVVALLVIGSSGFAQQRNVNPMSGIGNILRPGIPLSGPPPQARTFQAIPGPTAFGQGVRGQFAPGMPGRGQGRLGQRFIGGFGGAVFMPSPIDGFGRVTTVHNPPPGYYDPIFGGYTPPVYAPVPMYEPAPPPTPTVVINQNFQTDPVRPQFRDYSNVQLPEPGVTTAPPASATQDPTAQAAPADDQPVVFLIALRDHTILPAVAYWVQGDTVNYITLQGAQNHVSLALIDRDFSRQLNAERKVPFRLPATQ